MGKCFRNMYLLANASYLQMHLFNLAQHLQKELEELLKQSPRLLYNASMDLLTAVLGTSLVQQPGKVTTDVWPACSPVG